MELLLLILSETDKDCKGIEYDGDAAMEEKPNIEEEGMEEESALKQIDNNVGKSVDSDKRKKQEDSKGGEYG